MKKTLALSALLAVGAVSQATTLFATLSFSGIPGVDNYGSPNNFVATIDWGSVNFGAGSPYSNFVVTGINWDVELSTVGNSWLFDMVVALENSDQSEGIFLRPGFATTGGGTQTFSSDGNEDAEGYVDLVAENLDYALNADDIMRVEFFDDFQDLPDGEAEGFWNGEIGLRFEAEPVPEPGTMAALGLGLAAAARRRRAK